MGLHSAIRTHYFVKVYKTSAIRTLPFSFRHFHTISSIILVSFFRILRFYRIYLIILFNNSQDIYDIFA